MVSNQDEYKSKIKSFLLTKIPNWSIIDNEAFEQWINVVYDKLLYNEDIIYSIDGKNYYISRDDILKE
jgi:hypothetical protein